MPSRFLRCVAALTFSILATGCHQAVRASLQMSATRHFDPRERAVAYGRALTVLQSHRMMITQADPIGGLIRTERQPAWMNCNGRTATARQHFDGRCLSLNESQLTISADGTAYLNTNTQVFGEVYQRDPLLLPEHENSLQARCDEIVAYIVGESKAMPPAPEPLPPTVEPPPNVKL
jgi:hypothetical protein